MSVELKTFYRVAQWLSMDEIRKLLDKGELTVTEDGTTAQIFVNFNDRAAARELIDREPIQKPKQES
jgi:hypothetical protein